MGTNQYRSTKRNIFSATVRNEAGAGWTITSDGSQHLRTTMESDRVAVFVNYWYGGSPAQIGEYQENYGPGRKLSTGEHLRSTIRFQLLSKKSDISN
jgi:beta-galactosidase